MNKKCKNIFAIILIMYFSIGNAKVLIVGHGNGPCDYNSLTEAVNDAEPLDEIRVTTEQVFFETIFINKDLVLKGGYSTCQMAQFNQRDSSLRTELVGDVNGDMLPDIPLVILDLNGEDVLISGFKLSHGLGGDFTAGGLTLTGHNSSAHLDYMTIEQNQSNGSLGGGGIGVYANSDPYLSLSIGKSIIQNNVATNGGGIYSDGGYVVIKSDVRIANNLASSPEYDQGNGGGIAVYQGVSLQLHDGLNLADMGIIGNQATGSGGGIYAHNSTVDSSYEFNDLINIKNNIANLDSTGEGNGGGVYLSGPFSVLRPLRMNFEGNAALVGHGGGLYMDDLSQILVLPTPTEGCVNEDGRPTYECLVFDSNMAYANQSTDSFGGAMYLSQVQMHSNSQPMGALFKYNQAYNGSAVLLNAGSIINFQNSTFYRNGDPHQHSVIRAEGPKTYLILAFSTLANNNSMNVLMAKELARIKLIKSIIHESNPTNKVFLGSGGGSLDVACSLFHEISNFTVPDWDNSLVVKHPGFTNPEQDNFYLSKDSVAIDLCDGLGIDHPNLVDRDGNFRPLRDHRIDQIVFDAGSDEYHSAKEIIHWSGFE